MNNPTPNLLADLTSHKINGYAAAAYDRGIPAYFEVPLISHIHDNLYLGGCIDGVQLPDEFKYVISLYPWEQYRIGPDTERHEFKLYDSSEEIPIDEIDAIASMVLECLERGKTLVHCQAGLNRSSLVTALAMMLNGMTAKEAIALIREKRCELCLCNETFEKFLLSYKS